MTSSPLPLRLSILLSLYLAQGLPSGIFSQALPAILRSQHVSLAVIGYSSLLAAPWALKVFWSPLVDKHYSLRWGRARSWIVPLQLGTIVSVLVVAGFQAEQLQTTQGIIWLFAWMFLLNLFAATQDIATDGLAVRMLAPKERGLGNSVQVGGYRLGLIIGGGLLLYVLDIWGWATAFTVVALLLVLTSLPIVSYREPATESVLTTARLSYHHIFGSLFRQRLFQSWLWVLCSYKVGEGLGSAMVKPMLVDMGLSLKQIGLQVSVLGSLATILGAVLGGTLTTRYGAYRMMMWFGGLQALGLAGYGLLAWQWQQHQAIDASLAYGVNAFDHWASGMATVALLTAVMNYCRKEHASADFTLQVSLLAITGGLAGVVAGKVTELIGYTYYFELSVLLTLLCLWPVRVWGQQRIESGV